jgi:hypothetical protein
LNDSIQTLISEFKAKPTHSIDDIRSLLVNFLEKSEEMRTVVYETQFRVAVLEKKQDELSKKLDDADTKIVENSDAIEVIDRDIKKQSKRVDTLQATSRQNQSSLHKLEQLKVDNDIFLSGFPFKPDLKKITKAITNRYGISEAEVSNSYQYKFKVRSKKPTASSTPSNDEQSSRVFHHSFKDKSSKMKLIS